MIDRFGAAAVYGRPMGVGEMRRIVLAENVVSAYQAHARAEGTEAGSARWAEQYPQAASLLAWAMKAANSDE